MDDARRAAPVAARARAATSPRARSPRYSTIAFEGVAALIEHAGGEPWSDAVAAVGERVGADGLHPRRRCEPARGRRRRRAGPRLRAVRGAAAAGRRRCSAAPKTCSRSAAPCCATTARSSRPSRSRRCCDRSPSGCRSSSRTPPSRGQDWGFTWNLRHTAPGLLASDTFGHGGWAGAEFWITPVARRLLRAAHQRRRRHRPPRRRRRRAAQRGGRGRLTPADPLILVGVHSLACPVPRVRRLTADQHEGRRLRPVRAARRAEGRRGSGAVAGREPGARQGRRDIRQPLGLGGADGNSGVRADRRTPRPGAPGARLRHRRTRHSGRLRRHPVARRRRGIRRQPESHGRLRRVRGGARSGARPQAAGADLRRGLDAAPVGRDRASGNRARTPRAARADQRGGRRVGLVRDPARQARPGRT